MPAVQHSAFSALPSPVHIGGDDVAVTDDDDSLFVQIGCFVETLMGSPSRRTYLPDRTDACKDHNIL